MKCGIYYDKLQMAVTYNAFVRPFVIEHYGRWGEDALAFARQLAPAPDHGRSEAMAAFYQDVACAVQKANADAIIAAARAAGRGVRGS